MLISRVMSTEERSFSRADRGSESVPAERSMPTTPNPRHTHELQRAKSDFRPVASANVLAPTRSATERPGLRPSAAPAAAPAVAAASNEGSDATCKVSRV